MKSGKLAGEKKTNKYQLCLQAWVGPAGFGGDLQQLLKPDLQSLLTNQPSPYTIMSDEGEIEISAHQISVEELCKMLNTNVETGLTDAQVKERQKEEKQGIDPEEDVPMAQVRRNGSLVEIPAADLVVGDIVEVKLKGPLVLYSPTDTYSDYYFGEDIPADIRIVKADGFKVT